MPSGPHRRRGIYRQLCYPQRHRRTGFSRYAKIGVPAVASYIDDPIELHKQPEPACVAFPLRVAACRL